MEMEVSTFSNALTIIVLLLVTWCDVIKCKAVSIPRLHPPEFQDLVSSANTINFPGRVLRPQYGQKFIGSTYNLNKVQGTVPTVLAQEGRIKQILYTSPNKNGLGKQAPEKSVETQPPSTTFKPRSLSSRTKVAKEPVKPPESSISDLAEEQSISTPSIPKRLPQLHTVVPYELWPYSTADSVRFSSSYPGDKENTNTTASPPPSAPETNDNDPSAVQLKYYTPLSVHTRSTNSTSSSRPTPSPGLSYSYFIFGSSSSSPIDSENLVTTDEPLIPTYQIDDIDSTIEITKNKKKATSSNNSRFPNSRPAVSKPSDGHEKTPTYREENDQGYKEIQAVENNPTDVFSGPSIYSDEQQSSFLSFPGPPYRNDFPTTIFEVTTRLPENEGFIPPPSVSPVYEEPPKPTNFPSKSIYDEIAKFEISSSFKPSNSTRNQNRPEIINIMKSNLSDTKPLVKTPPTLEDEVLSFIQSYSEKPFKLTTTDFLESNYPTTRPTVIPVQVNQTNSKPVKHSSNEILKTGNKTTFKPLPTNQQIPPPSPLVHPTITSTRPSVPNGVRKPNEVAGGQGIPLPTKHIKVNPHQVNSNGTIPQAPWTKDTPSLASPLKVASKPLNPKDIPSTKPFHVETNKKPIPTGRPIHTPHVATVFSPHLAPLPRAPAQTKPAQPSAVVFPSHTNNIPPQQPNLKSTLHPPPPSPNSLHRFPNYVPHPHPETFTHFKSASFYSKPGFKPAGTPALLPNPLYYTPPKVNTFNNRPIYTPYTFAPARPIRIVFAY